LESESEEEEEKGGYIDLNENAVNDTRETMM